MSKKKINNNQMIEQESASAELRKLSTIILSIVGVICVFYIITMLVTKNNGSLKYQPKNEIAQISYTQILGSDILKKNGTYYVLVENDDDEYISLFKTYISTYTSSDEHLDFYYVDLKDALNKKYLSEKSNVSIDNLKFSDTTLLKISNGNIESSYTDSNSINEHLKSLASK